MPDASARWASLSTSGNRSLPHQPPLYGVSSGWPTVEPTYGPTIVPCRVMTPSTQTSKGRIRRITFSSCDVRSSRYFAKSSAVLTKKVVRPESPYGVCTTRSSPTPCAVASWSSSSYEPARPSTFGTLGTPASLPICVVTIFESSRFRSAAGGWMISSPTSAARRSVSSSNITNAALPPGPCLSRNATTSLWPSR